MKKLTKAGKIMAFIGIWIFAFGSAFKIIDITEPYSSFSIPMIVVGILLLIASNFFKGNRKSQT